MINQNRFIHFFIYGMVLFLQGCIGSALISDFPTSATAYNFDTLSSLPQVEDAESSRVKTIYEYYIESEVLEDSMLVETVTGAMKLYGYHVKVVNLNENAIVAQKGLKASEWNSVVGVYFKTTDAFSAMYIKVHITQDFTGGPARDRAMELGKLICRTLQTCTKSYAIKTIEPEMEDEEW